MAETPSYRSLDARTLRGLAHPVRVRMLSVLRLDGPATVSGLAERLGIRPGSASWHVQKLAEHGFVEEIAERGRGRTRWWRASGPDWSIDAATFLADPELADASGIVLAAAIEQYLARATQFVYEDWPRSWRRAWILQNTDALRLTPESLAAMRTELWDVVSKYLTNPEPSADAERVVLQMQGFPIHTPEETS